MNDLDVVDEFPVPKRHIESYDLDEQVGLVIQEAIDKEVIRIAYEMTDQPIREVSRLNPAICLTN